MIKSKFWPKLGSTETKKRITKDLDIKKACFGEIPT